MLNNYDVVLLGSSQPFFDQDSKERHRHCEKGTDEKPLANCKRSSFAGLKQVLCLLSAEGGRSDQILPDTTTVNLPAFAILVAGIVWQEL